MKKVRSSNFELLRILAMVMVIGLHFVGSANALAQLKSGDINYFWIHFYEAMCICSVDCFVLISGYFMIHKAEPSLKKLLTLLIDVAFWSILGILLGMLVWGNTVSLKELIFAVLPYIKGGRWFVRDYIILMLLAPFINVCLTRLSKASYRILIVVLMLFLSVWPSFFPNPPIDAYGYNFTHFILLYVIAGYLKLHMTWNPGKWCCVLVYFFSVALIFMSSVIGMGYAYAYNYVFVMTAAVSLFLFFRGIKIQSPVINQLAAGAFDVFVIHTTGFFANLIYSRVFHAETVIFDAPWKCILISLICPPVFYLFCACLSWIKRWIYKYTVDKAVAWLPIHNYQVK